MKQIIATAILFFIAGITIVFSQSKTPIKSVEMPATKYFLDVHHLAPGKITDKDLAKAHAKDLATQSKYGVHFIKYWFNQKEGLVYCLATAPDAESLSKTHSEAHGLLPDKVYEVTEGEASIVKQRKNLFLDFHELGAGNVKAKDVAAAHKKDLAEQKKNGVQFIDYWVDEKDGVVVCVSDAKDSASIARTHQQAHGLMPVKVVKVKEGH
jgi:hypothetical protein